MNLIKLEYLTKLRSFEINDNVSIFDSYTFVDFRTYKVHRYCQDITNWYKCSLILNDKDDIGSGEDPRLFLWNDLPYVYSVCFSPDHGWINRIYSISTSTWFNLVLPNDLKIGKNWSPFSLNGELYFVHQFSPFRVLKASKIHEKDGFILLKKFCEFELENDISIDGFPCFRGGSNGLQIEGKVIGFGHTNKCRLNNNIDYLEHRPFVWQFDPKGNIDCQQLDFPFNPDFQIIDPTSFCKVQNDYYLFTCESKKPWHIKNQEGRACVYKVLIG